MDGVITVEHLRKTYGVAAAYWLTVAGLGAAGPTAIRGSDRAVRGFADHPVDSNELIGRWRLDGQRDQAFDGLSGGQWQRDRRRIRLVSWKAVNGPLQGR